MKPAVYDPNDPDGIVLRNHEFERGDHVKVNHREGVAWWYANPCDIQDRHHPDCVIVVMVGDDVGHHEDKADLTPIDREEFCGSCGQMGCGHG